MYKNPLNLTSQFYFCGLPLRLDSYSGCSFKCKFCFALNRGGKNYWSKVNEADPSFIEKKFQFIEKRKSFGVVNEMLIQRVPIHFGGMSDPLQKAELKFGITLSFLKSLAKRNYPLVISTRSPLAFEEPYISIFKNYTNLLLQFSFTTFDDKKISTFEPFSSKASEILKGINKLRKHGINVSIRWQPYIPEFSEHPNEVIDKLSDSGAQHVAIEYLKIPLPRGRNLLWNNMLKPISDTNQLYNKLGSNVQGREILLNIENRKETILSLRDNLHKRNISFGAADIDLLYLSDANCCCSGADLFKGFENWFKFQFSYAVKKSFHSHTIQFSSIEKEWNPKASIKEYIYPNSRLKDNDNSVFQHIKHRWNNLISKNNPTMFEGVKPTDEFDSTGMRIYKWDSGIRNRMIN